MGTPTQLYGDKMDLIYSLLLLVSLIFFIIGVYQILNVKKMWLKIFSAILIFLNLSSYYFYVIVDSFTGRGMDTSVLYFLRNGLVGAGFGEYSFFILLGIIYLLFSAILSYLISFKFYSPYKKLKINAPYLSIIFLVLSLLITPFLISSISQGVFSTFVDDVEYSLDLDSESDFYDYYRVPTIEQRQEPKNFVIIYGESLENTYFNESLFPDLLPNLKELKKEGLYFKNIKQTPNSGHTIAGMVAQQCGLPLKTPSSELSMFGMDKFLPLATCFGDLLYSEGYGLHYYGGAKLSFGGKGKFYTTHGFSKVFGIDELFTQLKDENYLTYWGLYDDELLNLTFDSFEKLNKQEEKFGLVVLTLDTHHPRGYISKSCENLKYRKGEIEILNAVQCSDKLISEFIKKVQDSETGNETVIILLSDHLSQSTDASKILESSVRTNTLIIWDPFNKQTGEIEVTGNNYDIGPTLLSVLGYDAEIGLGRNLLDLEQKSLPQKIIKRGNSEWTKDIYNFWSFPSLKKGLYINYQTNYVVLDNRIFLLPLMIQFTEDGETKLNFEFSVNPTWSDAQLYNIYNDLNENEMALLIQKCSQISNLVQNYSQGDICLKAKLRGLECYGTIDKNVELTFEEILRFCHE